MDTVEHQDTSIQKTLAQSVQEALEIVESLPEDQQETLIAVVRHRLVEHTRDVLSKHIEEAREELSLGEARRGTVDDLMKEISDENAHTPQSAKSG